MDNATSARLNSMQMVGIGIAVVGVLVGLVGAFTNADRFWQMYLVSFQLWTDMSLGCLGFFLLLHLVDGRWGFVTRRVFAAGARVMPLMGLLFIPLIFRLPQLYAWAGAEEIGHGGYVVYHSVVFFAARVILYFAIWSGTAYLLSNWSYELDDETEERAAARYPGMQRFAALGMVLFFITVTFASFDWIMSLETEWFSTVFGWLFISRQGILAMSLALIVATVFAGDQAIAKLHTGRVHLDLSTLMLVTLMAWIYLTVIQYFIMWSGNQPSKIKWFVPRTTGEWETFVVFFSIAHAVPFLLLLTPGLKKFRALMLVIAGWLIFMRAAELFWMVVPHYTSEFTVSLWDVALPIGFGGVWLAAFAFNYKSHPTVPENHPQLREMLAHDTPEHLEGASVN